MFFFHYLKIYVFKKNHRKPNLIRNEIKQAICKMKHFLVFQLIEQINLLRSLINRRGATIESTASLINRGSCLKIIRFLCVPMLNCCVITQAVYRFIVSMF